MKLSGITLKVLGESTIELSIATQINDTLQSMQLKANWTSIRLEDRLVSRITNMPDDKWARNELIRESTEDCSVFVIPGLLKLCLQDK